MHDQNDIKMNSFLMLFQTIVEGSYGEMVWGLMLGFFMGLMVLFWFKEATFSRRQQMGKFAFVFVFLGRCLSLNTSNLN